MNKDLFGNKIRVKKDGLSVLLKKEDASSFAERLERVKYLDKIMPSSLGLLLSDEMHYILAEVNVSFISGQFVATILLTQSFIEHWLANRVAKAKLKKYGRSGLDSILKAMIENDTANIGLLKKIDRLRKIRNPFVHSKSFNDEYNISKLAINKKITPEELLEKEAKDAISLLYQVCITKFSNAN